MTNAASELKERYEQIAKTLDYNTTACDYNLRDLEINTACEYIQDGDSVLDIGCGLGYGCTQYAARRNAHVHGIDYAENMIDGAKELCGVTILLYKALWSLRMRQCSISHFPKRILMW